MINIRSNREIEKLRKAGRLTAETHTMLKEMLKPGITTIELDEAAESFIRDNGGVPAFKGYSGFPGTICISINNEVVHGIPGHRKIETGDLVSIDTGAIVEGYYGDAARSYVVGEIDEQSKKLVQVCEECFFEGLKFAKPGHRLSDISHAIQTYVEKNGFSVVRDYVGHGVGQKLHEDPQVPHFGPPGRGPRLRKGMVLAIEPMINFGSYHVEVLDNNWTVVTADGSLSSHYENTIVITDDEPEILTLI